MGCGPSVKKAQQIPVSNAKPSNKNVTSLGNFVQRPLSTSNIKQNNFDEIIKNDIYVK